ncbi:MAG: YraN family protein [Lachnospiraceae bacterium]|nr:YraN family protein [Lachnospiraceae bacterium]
MNKRSVGTAYEQRAADYLKELGYRILEHSFRCRTGEVDLVCWSPEGILVFAEVKYRRNASKGTPAEAVTPAKQRTISRVAAFYLVRYRVDPRTQVRFDVIAFLGEEMTHYQNAFAYCP